MQRAVPKAIQAAENLVAQLNDTKLGLPLALAGATEGGKQHRHQSTGAVQGLRTGGVTRVLAEGLGMR
jgi:hypothetical protein